MLLAGMLLLGLTVGWCTSYYLVAKPLMYILESLDIKYKRLLDVLQEWQKRA